MMVTIENSATTLHEFLKVKSSSNCNNSNHIITLWSIYNSMSSIHYLINSFVNIVGWAVCSSFSLGHNI